MTTIEVPASVDVLISNTLALLLEPLGVDGTVGVSDLNELAGKTASIQASCLAFDNGLGDAIANVISLAASTALTQARVINIAAQYKPAAEAADAARLLEWLSYPELGRHLRSFEGVSESALQADHAEIAAAQRQLRLPLEMCRNANAKWPNGAHRTILDLGLDAAIRDLRDNGFLWIQTRSDGARDRVLKHMNSAAKRCSKGELAKKLELARDFSLASTTLDEKLHDSPRWWRWIVNRSTFQLQTTRIEALNWALMKRDADTISSDTMNLLTDGGWRRALHDCLREDPPAERPPVTATTLGSITCARLSAGLIVSGQPDSVALTAWKKWAHENTELLGRAAHVLDAADGHPAIAVQLDALGSSVQSVFGPPDTSRAKYRFIQAQVQEAVTTALSQRDQPAKPVEHTQLLGVTRTLGMLERALLQSVRATTPVQGILQVAIAGRTKSGKTTLRKALMRDGDRTGIGRGAQRTTRDVAKFVLDNVQFLDTPGVAAYDDDHDAEKAIQACLGADAVVWNYADALRDEEAEYVHALMAAGKPMVVVINVKWRVDTVERLALFAKRPQMAFRHESGHADRIGHLASEVGSPAPVVLPVHAGAAHESLSCPDPGVAERAVEQSRLPQLEEHLKSLLAERAVPLRAVRLADDIRTPLAGADALMSEELPAADAALATLDKTAKHQQRDLLDAIDVSERHAKATLEVRRKVAHDEVNKVLRKLGGSDSDKIWSRFIETLDLGATARDLEHRFGEEMNRADRTLRAEWRAETRSEIRRIRVRTRPGGRWLRRVFMFMWGAAKNVILNFRGFGGATRVAEGISPWILVAQVAADALIGGTKEINKDINKAREETRDWSSDASGKVRRELDLLLDRTERHLTGAVAEARRLVIDQYEQQKLDTLSARDRIRHLRDVQKLVQRGIRQLDITLASRLVTIGGGNPLDILGARRIPGSAFTVWVAPTNKGQVQPPSQALSAARYVKS